MTDGPAVPPRSPVGRQRTVVVIAPDAPSRLGIVNLLSGARYDARPVGSKAAGLAEIATEAPDLIVIVGRAMRGVVGYTHEVAAACASPILLVAAGPEDEVQALESGAIADAVSGDVLERALLVRAARLAGDPIDMDVVVCDDLVIHLRARTIQLDGAEVSVTPREFELLAFLATRPGRTFTRRQLLDQVWRDVPGHTRPATVGEHVYRLRHKLERDPSRPRWIVTMPHGGYRFGGCEASPNS